MTATSQILLLFMFEFLLVKIKERPTVGPFHNFFLCMYNCFVLSINMDWFEHRNFQSHLSNIIRFLSASDCAGYEPAYLILSYNSYSEPFYPRKVVIFQDKYNLSIYILVILLPWYPSSRV